LKTGGVVSPKNQQTEVHSSTGLRVSSHPRNFYLIIFKSVNFSDHLCYRQKYAARCIVFIHFYSASHSTSLSEVLPTTAIYMSKRYRRL